MTSPGRGIPPELPRRLLYPLAVLRGVLDHDRGDYYFGSLGGYLYYVSEAIAQGWIEDRGGKLEATEAGIDAYIHYRLDAQGSGRAAFWRTA